MYLIPVDESLCESALRITQAISHAFKWCWIYGLHQEVPHECIIMDDVRQCYMLDSLAANYKLTSLESTMRSKKSRTGVNYCKSYLDIIYYARACYLHVKPLCPDYWTLF